MLLLQDLTLLQGQGHGRAVFGTLAAGETHSVEAPTRLQIRKEVRGGGVRWKVPVLSFTHFLELQ